MDSEVLLMRAVIAGRWFVIFDLIVGGNIPYTVIGTFIYSLFWVATDGASESDGYILLIGPVDFLVLTTHPSESLPNPTQRFV